MPMSTSFRMGRKVFDTILGIDSTDNSTQMYIDEDAYAYMAWYMQKNGVFQTESHVDTSTVPQGSMPEPPNKFNILLGNSLQYTDVKNIQQQKQLKH